MNISGTYARGTPHTAQRRCMTIQHILQLTTPCHACFKALLHRIVALINRDPPFDFLKYCMQRLLLAKTAARLLLACRLGAYSCLMECLLAEALALTPTRYLVCFGRMNRQAIVTLWPRWCETCRAPIP